MMKQFCLFSPAVAARLATRIPLLPFPGNGQERNVVADAALPVRLLGLSDAISLSTHLDKKNLFKFYLIGVGETADNVSTFFLLKKIVTLNFTHYVA